MVGRVELSARGRSRQIQHVFQPIGTIGNLHHHPVRVTGPRATLPIQMKSKDIAIKMIRGCAIAHYESSVVNMRAHWVCRPGLLGWMRTLLREFDRVSFRIIHLKKLVSMLIDADGRWNRHSTCREETPQGFGVAG